MVIVRKKTGEIRLCVDFRKLNAISIRDSFPLPHVEEALQAVQAAVWFSSFDLAQGYLQMAMEEEDIEKNCVSRWLQWPLRLYLHAFWINQRGRVFLQTHGNVYRRPTIHHVTVLSGRYLYFRGNGR